jgi:CRISPR/Cas system CSM-associated protein Csm3 (group 7 of RAMP superfamily)
MNNIKDTILSGKLALKAIVELKSPLMLGSGISDNTDVDLQVDENGIPFIPATSLAGVIKSNLNLSEKDDLVNKIFGYSKKIGNKNDSYQSLLKISDMTLIDKDYKIVTRDGIRINNKTGLVLKGAKFDFEVLEPGVKFNIKMELDLLKEKSDDKIDDLTQKAENVFAAIYKKLENGELVIGAKTNNGFGKLKLVEGFYKKYDFTKANDVKDWLLLPFRFNTKANFQNNNEVAELIKSKANKFIINAKFDLKTSIISRTYSTDPELPDAVNIKSNGNDIIPGSGLKGAIRARAEKIVNTLAGKSLDIKENEIIKNLFGWEGDKGKDAKKGKLKVTENEIPLDLANLSSFIQTRIKIDRFTGGTIESALFESMPIFSNSSLDLNKKGIEIHIQVDACKDYEVGLLLLVLKDLWTGDLALGGEKNVGRGVLKGISADIIKDGKNLITITASDFEDENRLQEIENILQTFVSNLVSKVSNNKVEVVNG